MQPSQRTSDVKICKDDFDCLISLYGTLSKVFPHLVKWLLFYDDIAAQTLRLFLKGFTRDVERISHTNNGDRITQKIITYGNFRTSKISLFNLSHRVFMDILMGCCVKGTIPRRIRDQVLGDENMLMWIGRPTITALTSINDYIHITDGKNNINFEQYIVVYLKSNLRYFYLQDLNTLQILISYLDPEILLKYMLLNISVPMRKQADSFQSIPSILRSKEMSASNLSKFLQLIYIALTERHFVGVSDNPEYRLLERQIIHSLASGHRTLEAIKSNIFIDNEVFVTPLYCPSLKNTFDKVILNVSSPIDSRNSENRMSLKTKYFSTINLFYFTTQRSDVYQELKHLYRTRMCKFQFLDFVELRESFEGLNDFLYSDAFSDLIVHVVITWYTSYKSNKEVVLENLIVVSMMLCLMFKVPLNENTHSKFHKAVDLIFGIRKYLEGNNVMTILAFLNKKIDDDIFGSVIDHLLELSLIPADYFCDLSEDPTYMKKKSKGSLYLAWQNLQKKYKEILRNKKNSQSDNPDLVGS
ncbi:hypothetical protein RF11_04262 [Thelohanellus kitauei]|uniref:E3 ubiquitin-protein ligase n=1 Tax=Thelohanellus kitauei TaxID=669202 RepID=A0A0C2IMJ0_THEKT|nr:hypothetical protein RF11_04262 [Thelohanellus kitauei]